MRKLLSGLFVSSLCILTINAETVPLTLQNPSKTEYKNWPLTFGVPFAKDAVSSGDKFILKDSSGKEIPIQTEITSTWSLNGPARWLLIDFPADLNGSEKQNYTFEYGKDLKNITPGKSITVKNIEQPFSGYEIQNDFLKLTVRKDAFNLFDSVTANGKVLVKEAKDSGPYIIDASGKTYMAAWGQPDEVKIEEAGPLRVVVCAKGWYYAKDGEKFCRYLVRTHIFADQPFVKVLYTFIISGDTDRAKFKDIGLSVPVESAKAVFGGLEGKAYQSSGKSQYLLQYDCDKFAVRKDGETLEWDKNPDGKKAPGWIKVSGNNGSVLMSVRDFWQQFPKELEFTDKSLVFHAWPSHGIAKTDRKIEDAMIQYLWFVHEGKVLDFKVPESYIKHKEGHSEYEYRYLASGAKANCMGLAKTHELLFAFESADSKKDDKILALWDRTPSCLASPEYMCSTGVFGKLHPYDIQKFPEVEKGLSRAFDCERRLEDHTRDYGMFNYGDGHTGWDFKRNRWSDVYRCWRAFHHGAPRVPWILYVRSGDRKYLDFGIRSARHLMDIDVCNYTIPELEKKPYPDGKILGALNDYKGIVHWHSGSRLFDYNTLTDFMLYYYYLTGDKKGLEAAVQWGESVKKRYNKPFGHREGAGTTSSLIDLYQATWDEGYKKIIDKQMEYMLSTQNMEEKNQNATAPKQNSDNKALSNSELPYGAFPQWENYAPWIEKYWLLTGDEKTGQRIVAWADAYIAGWGDSCSQYGGIQVNIPAYAYFVSKDPKYLSYGMKLMNNFISSIENSPGSLMDGFAHSGQVSLGYGYMAQRLPYLLQALSEAKEPIKEDWSTSDKFSLPFSLIFSNKNKTQNIDFILFDEKDADFKIILGGIVTYTDKSPIKVTVVSPSGKKVAEKDFTPGKGSFDLSLAVAPDGEKGAYKVTVSRKGSYWYLANPVKTEPVLKAVFPVTNKVFVTKNGSGAGFYFMVPEKVKSFTVKTVSNGYFAVFTPDGQLAAKVTSTPGKETITEVKTKPDQTGKLWGLRGDFEGCTMEFSSKDAEIPPYFATNPELFFTPKSNK
ncbi:MAG: hypothetical protein A2017_08395 [Lentisphaerae bacterium GWF2_44_16]|nr:MAG: hypothetical protein A2017_08395 [Lentisphaerae bacterium GWF2_44_16]